MAILLVPSYDIVVIGTQNVGKTILNKTIRGLEYDKDKDEGTGEKPLPKAMLTIGGKQIKIKSGWDYGGIEDLRYHYNRIVKRRTIVILLFNTEKYMNNTVERDRLLGRIVGLMEKRVSLKDVYIIGSFYDKVKDKYKKKDIRNRLIEDIKKENEQTIIDDDHIWVMSFGHDEVNDENISEFKPDFTEIEDFKLELFKQI